MVCKLLAGKPAVASYDNPLTLGIKRTQSLANELDNIGPQIGTYDPAYVIGAEYTLINIHDSPD
jgi:hypothetical protein